MNKSSHKCRNMILCSWQQNAAHLIKEFASVYPEIDAPRQKLVSRRGLPWQFENQCAIQESASIPSTSTRRVHKVDRIWSRTIDVILFIRLREGFWGHKRPIYHFIVTLTCGYFRPEDLTVHVHFDTLYLSEHKCGWIRMEDCKVKAIIEHWLGRSGEPVA